MGWLQQEAQRIQAMQALMCSMPYPYFYYSYLQTQQLKQEPTLQPS